MQRDVLLVLLAGLSLLNGTYASPWLDPAFFLLGPFAASFGVSSPLVLLYLTSLFVSLLTLLLAGIPAAIFERTRGLDDSTPASLGIWAGGVALLSLPTVIGFFGPG